MLKDHICPNCRMWAYIYETKDKGCNEGYYCFEDMKWIMKEPEDGSPREYIPYFDKKPCPHWRKRFDVDLKRKRK